MLPNNKNVFINCPFDKKYKQLFDAIIFTICDCGYYPHCALEIDNAAQTRIAKIQNLIAKCHFGIHDISATELDNKNKLPRFNMPFELGLFIGAKRYGNSKQKNKQCLILDKTMHRYRKFISDISGQDVNAHDFNLRKLIRIIRNWFANNNKKIIVPGHKQIHQDYELFLRLKSRQS